MKRNLKKVIAVGVILSLAGGAVFAKSKKSKKDAVPTDSFNGHVAKEANAGYVDVTGSGVLTSIAGIARARGFFDEEFSKIGVKLNLVPMTGAGLPLMKLLQAEALIYGSLEMFLPYWVRQTV